MMRHPENDTFYTLLPAHLRDGMRRWIEDGHRPGHFLCAVLANDFAEAAVRADYLVAPNLAAIARWVYNEAPAPCWGSPAAMDEWERLCREDPRCLCGGLFSEHRRGGCDHLGYSREERCTCTAFDQEPPTVGAMPTLPVYVIAEENHRSEATPLRWFDDRESALAWILTNPRGLKHEETSAHYGLTELLPEGRIGSYERWCDHGVRSENCNI